MYGGPTETHHNHVAAYIGASRVSPLTFAVATKIPMDRSSLLAPQSSAPMRVTGYDPSEAAMGVKNNTKKQGTGGAHLDQDNRDTPFSAWH